MTENTPRPALRAIETTPQDETARKVEEAYLNLFEAIRGKRPSPKRPDLRAV